jgi:hypothetical protein
MDHAITIGDVAVVVGVLVAIAAVIGCGVAVLYFFATAFKS